MKKLLFLIMLSGCASHEITENIPKVSYENFTMQHPEIKKFEEVNGLSFKKEFLISNSNYGASYETCSGFRCKLEIIAVGDLVLNLEQIKPDFYGITNPPYESEIQKFTTNDNKKTVEFPVFKIKLKDRYIRNVVRINQQKQLQWFWMEFHTTENYQQIVQRLNQVLGKPSVNNLGLNAHQMS